MLVLLQPRKHEAMLPSSGRMMQYRCVFNKNHDKMEPAARPWQCRSEDPRLPLRKSEGKGEKKKQIKQQQKTNTKIAPPAVEIKAVILCGIWTTTFSNARCGADGLEIIELWQSRTETQFLSTKKKKNSVEMVHSRARLGLKATVMETQLTEDDFILCWLYSSYVFCSSFNVKIINFCTKRPLVCILNHTDQ